MNEFKAYHPFAGLLYFSLVIVLSCVLYHPVFVAISLCCGAVYSVMLGGRRRLRFIFIFILPLMMAAALINPAFNHGGITILTYLPSGNPLTLESILFGIAAAGVLASVICHFYNMGEIMTSDKLIYLFGRLSPALSLVLSMTLRFVPRLRFQLKEITAAQRAIGRDRSGGSLLCRAKNGIRILSAMLSLSLERSIDTADSMKARGYGLSDRTAYSDFILCRRDAAALTAAAILGIYVILGIAYSGRISYSFFPYIRIEGLNLYGISVFAAYLLLCSLPIIIETREAIRWRSLKQKL